MRQIMTKYLRLMTGILLISLMANLTACAGAANLAGNMVGSVVHNL